MSNYVNKEINQSNLTFLFEKNVYKNPDTQTADD